MEVWERLLDELRRELMLREKELDLLHRIDLKLLKPGQSAPEIFDFIVAETKQLLEAGHTTILFRRSDFLEPMYSNQPSVIGQRVLIAESLTGFALQEKKTVNIRNLATDPLREKYAMLRGYSGPEMHSLLATPIKMGETIVGVLNVESPRAGAFEAVHERIMVAIAAQIAMALDRTQTLASTALFVDIDRIVLENNDSPDAAEESGYRIQMALERVMTELQRIEHIKPTGAQIMVLRGQSELEIIHSTNPADVGRTLLIDKSVCGRAVRESRTIIVNDVSKAPEYQRMLGELIRSEIAVPIQYSDNLVTGVLNVESEEANAFSDFYKVVLENFAGKVKTLLALAKLRTDVVEALEMRNADDLLVAVGDQTTHLIHRLNNVVGAMRLRIMELQEIQENGSLDPESLREHLGSLLNLAERTLKMPEEVIRQLGQDGVTINVNASVVEALSKIEIKDSIKVRLELSDDVPPLALYSFDIVVQNLLQNAVDAMPDGGMLSVTSSVMIHPTFTTGHLLLSIRDTGTGIPEDVQRRMFDLNFTTKGSKGKGLGFGLWSVRNFIRRARGDVIVWSQPGVGTEVTVKLPFDRQVAAG